MLLARAENTAEQMRQEMRETKAIREKELAETRRRLNKLKKAVVEETDTITPRIAQEWDQQLKELDFQEQTLIGQVQACDDIVYRLEQVSLETEATLDQVNCIQELWDTGDIDPLREVIDLLVDEVIVRADEKQYEVRVRLNPLPVVREVFETIPNRKEAAPAVRSQKLL